VTFREAFTKACDANQKASGKFYKRWQAAELDAKDRRVFWSMAERIVSRRYRRATGHVGKIDWQAAWDWIVKNLPAILQILMTILMLF
jgi:hypothetical protein